MSVTGNQGYKRRRKMKTIVADPQGRGWKVVELSFIGGNPPSPYEDDTDPDPTSPAGAVLPDELADEEIYMRFAA